MSTIGFLGLGAMGLPMAKRLCAAGHRLVVAVHSNPAPVKELEALGAKAVAGPTQVVTEAEYVISILPEDKQIREVLLAPEVMAAMPSSAILVEMSSARSATVEEVAAAYSGKGVRVLDAPVSGGVTGAEEGKLTIMCGGEAAVLETVRPLLEIMGSKIHLVGGMGAGKNLKAVNNMLGAANTALVAEALSLVRKMGLDPEIAHQVISPSSGQSYNFDHRFKRMAEENFAGGFKLWLMIKDMRIALSEADGVSMPLSSLAYQLYQMADEADRDLDSSAVSRVFSRTK